MLCLSQSTGVEYCLVRFARCWEKVFHHLARQKESRIEEGHIMLDHVGRDEQVIREYIRH